MKYVNGLLLKHPQTGEALTLNPDSRSGSFYDYLMECLNASATGFLSRLDAGISKQTYSVTDYLTGQHYRIRVGASDADTAFTVSMVLAVKLANAGILWIMPWCGTSPTAKPIIPEKYCNGSMRFAGRKTDERE